MTSFATNASHSEPVVGRRARNPAWHTRIMRFFNTTGPVRLDRHYGIPPLQRLDLDEVLMLVRQEQYFVLRAPRQTGKTSALLALRDLLNGGTVGEYRAVYFNVEAAQAMRENVHETCFRDKTGRDRTRPITVADILNARETLIVRRETHLDQLADKLREERVRRVVEPILSGGDEPEFSSRDTGYVRDLGLVAVDSPLRIANPIYAEVVPRELTSATQEALTDEAAWYVAADGGLDVAKLLGAFQRFFREHSEHWAKRFQYQEAWPQLLLQAFAQRIVNGGGRIEREYGLGRGRVDLLLVWPRSAEPDAPVDRHVVECKVVHGSLDRTVRQGVEQTTGYMDRCEADSGHLVVFDRSEGKTWKEKVFRREEAAPDGRTVTVWGM